MNIALAVYSHYSRDARVRRYAQSLARRGFKVDVVCLKENYRPKEANISLIMYPLFRRRYNRIWYFLEYLLFFIYTTVVLSVKTSRKHYRIIHINNMPDFLVFSAIFAKLAGAEVILDMHDPMPELYMSKYHAQKDSLMVKLLKRLEGLSLNFADKVITANPEFKKMFLKRNPHLADKISVILNCPDPKVFKPITLPRRQAGNYQLAMSNKSFTLLYMGTVDKRFGLDIAIEAIPELIGKIPSLKFVIIPKLEEEGEYLKNLKFRIQNSELEKYIQFLSPRPLEKIVQEIRKADAGIVLAKNGIFTESIFPVKLLEYIQSGIPVIATKTKCLARYFDNEDILFLGNNTSEEFAQAVQSLFSSLPLRKTLVRNAKKYFEKYNWTAEEKKYLQMIDSLKQLNYLDL